VNIYKLPPLSLIVADTTFSGSTVLDYHGRSTETVPLYSIQQDYY